MSIAFTPCNAASQAPVVSLVRIACSSSSCAPGDTAEDLPAI
jgi:hypothetical protein